MRTKDDVKEKLILEKALSMISKIGLSGLKMSLLAKEVGVATGTIYIYFKDKKDLIDNLYVYLVKKKRSFLLKICRRMFPLKRDLRQL
jgi:AcrR family transcriptional regulator